MARIRSIKVGVTCCLMLATATGCGGHNAAEKAIAKVNATNIQRLANLYFTYQMKNEWRGPTDEAEFKDFIRGLDPRKLTRIGIDPNAIDELFINERDEQLFKIRYSVAGSAMGSAEPVVFESVGVRGKRMVGFLNMEQREVDGAEYNDLWAGKTHVEQLRSNTPWQRSAQ
jgi:hypothetical protein